MPIFTLAQGTISIAGLESRVGSARIAIVSTADGAVLHDGAPVAPDGAFAVTFPLNPKRAWKEREIREISFVVYLEGYGQHIARGPGGRIAWRRKKLPLDDLGLHVEVGQTRDKAVAEDEKSAVRRAALKAPEVNAARDAAVAVKSEEKIVRAAPANTVYLTGTVLRKLDQLSNLTNLGAVATNTGKLDSIDRTLAAHTNQLGNLGAVAANTAKLDSIDKALAAHTNQLGNLSTVATNTGKLDSIDKALAAHSSKLDNLSTVATNTGKLGEVATKLDGLAGKVPLMIGASNDEVQSLHDRLTAAGYSIPAHEKQTKTFGVGTRDALAAFQAARGLGRTGAIDEATRALLVNTGSGRRIEGRVFVDSGAPAGGVKLKVYSRGVGDTASYVGETVTDEQGFYAVSHNVSGAVARLEIRAVGAHGEIALMPAKLGAGQHEVAHLVAPAEVLSLPTEFKRLCDRLTPTTLGGVALADLREDDERRDLSSLQAATGWDARVLSLRATAAQRGRDTQVNEEALYGMARVGLPTDARLLAGLKPEVVSKALGKARAAGIIGLSDADIESAKGAHARYVKTARLAERAPGVGASVGDMLARSTLTAADQAKFADIYTSHEGTEDELWSKVQASGLPVGRLKLHGKLGYLTLNNPRLTESLVNELSAQEGLVDNGLHRTASWEARLRSLAGSAPGELEKLIPPAYAGDTTDQRLQAYCADLARKVRLGFPTQVVRSLVLDPNGISLGKEHDTLKSPVSDLLQKAVGIGFALGRTPLGSFIKANESKLFPAGMAPDLRAKTQQAVETLHRLYQISPSDEAMKALLDAGFTSAREVLAYRHEAFLARFGKSFRSLEEASLVYRKAQQVSVVAHGFFGSAAQLAASPALHVLSPADPGRRQQAQASLVQQFPTLETLFGALDFCECDHCRSVLSPAAYLVDLLQFLDRDHLAWARFIEDWKNKHGGLKYPCTTRDEETALGPLWDPAQATPYAILRDRRPDLVHLPLTCENTNTEMPYIDLVNEVLEYYVVHDARGEAKPLEGFQGYDTGASSSADLIAEPQHILEDAYSELKKQRHPLALPFDLWLEVVRAFLGQIECSFWQVLDALRAGDDLIVPAGDPRKYGRADVCAERLGIGPAELRLFTDTNPAAAWHELYGYKSAADATAALRSAKVLSRRLGVTYKELSQLVGTGFVNPATNKLVLDDLGAGCDFDKTTLKYTDGTPPTPIDLVRLHVFVRLWRKVGSTIRALDEALRSFVPASVQPLDTGPRLGAAMQTALVRLAHLKEIEARVDTKTVSRTELLSLWSGAPREALLGVLARAVNLPAPELTALAALSGLDPFPRLGAAPLATASDDVMLNGTIRFLDIVALVKESGFTVPEIECLLREAFDPVGPLRPDVDAASRLLAELRNQKSIDAAAVARSVAQSLSADPALIAALLASAAALADPRAPGEPLFDAFERAFNAPADTAAEEAARRAYRLVEKTSRIAGGFGLNERELGYLRANAAAFDGFDPGKLPVRPEDDSLPAAQASFAWFLRLAAYKRLRRALGVSGGDLVDALEGKTPLYVFLRRTAATVQTMTAHLGLAPAALSTEKGLARLWEALQIVEKLRIAADTALRWATPAPDLSVAREIIASVRARYGRETWLSVAPTIWDGLRQRRRDALVASVMGRLGLDRQEQLFERLLLDPGMEPVVRTSRVRLALSSIQLFIQRCLLNLEPLVHPSAIDSRQWQWMKRYRVWEANRKIFLFPENWLEPELRDEKTHLFQELEGALLQGDVSNDLVEDAFFQYLKQLEALARLEIMAMYAEEKPQDPAGNVLHVVGRTYGDPHKYFYRRFAHRAWTPWEPVTVDIEGDHIVAAVWRDRLHLFWVTFLEKGETKSSGDTFEDLAKKNVSESAGKRVDVQLNWTEYAQGQWMARASSGFGEPMSVSVGASFDAHAVRIHVSKEYDGGEEGAVLIHLGAPIGRAFRVTSKNGRPEITPAGAAPGNPYIGTTAWTTQQRGFRSLGVHYASEICSPAGTLQQIPKMTDKTIVQQTAGAYSIVLPGNEITLPSKDVGHLVAPFFLQDQQNTFFVEPTMTERTVDTWQEWVIRHKPPVVVVDDARLDDIVVTSHVPRGRPEYSVPFDPETKFKLKEEHDWLTHPATELRVGAHLIGPKGKTSEAAEGARVRVGGAGLHASSLGHLRTLRADDLDVDGPRASKTILR